MVHAPHPTRLTTWVGVVPTPPDLKIATAYVLPLGGEGREDVIALLARNKGELRRKVAKRLTLKFAPDLRFRLDETFDRMDETRAMLNEDRVRRDTQPSDQ
ncbi:MAG: ribosome-binding factor A [Pseudomonadota bacterium]